MEFVQLLLRDDAERAHFAADPEGTLAHHGLGELTAADVHDAVVLVQDTLTVDWARAYGVGAGATPTRPFEPVAAPSPSDDWPAEQPDPVAEPEDVPPHHDTPDVTEALFDTADLHSGH